MAAVMTTAFGAFGFGLRRDFFRQRIAFSRIFLADIGDIQNRLRCHQLQLAQNFAFLGGQARQYRAHGFAGLQRGKAGSITVNCSCASFSPSLAFFCVVDQALFKTVEIGQHQFGFHRFGVADRIDRAFDMGDIAAFETAQHMDDGIDLADMRQKLIAQPFAARRAAHQTRRYRQIPVGSG